MPRVYWTAQEENEVVSDYQSYRNRDISKTALLSKYPGRKFSAIKAKIHRMGDNGTTAIPKSLTVQHPMLSGVYKRLSAAGVSTEIARFALFGGQAKLTPTQVKVIEKNVNRWGAFTFRLSLAGSQDSFKLETV